MAFRAIYKNATKKVVCPFDTEEPKSVFVISEALPYEERNRIRDEYSEYSREIGGRTVFRNYAAKRAVDIVRLGLKGVDNFFVNGEPFVLKFDENGLVSKESIQSLSIPLPPSTLYDTLIDWLGDEIWSVNRLSETEVKN